jgi:hypothetical protein
MTGVAAFAGGDLGSSTPTNLVDLAHLTTPGPALVWSSATLSQPRISPVGARAGARLLFAGGYVSQSSYSRIVDIFDGSQWTVASLSSARFGIFSSDLGQYVLFAGGLSGTQLSLVDVFDGASWNVTSLSQGRSLGAGCAGILAGGQVALPPASQVTNVVE